jgi:hypothetical protein
LCARDHGIALGGDDAYALTVQASDDDDSDDEEDE